MLWWIWLEFLILDYFEHVLFELFKFNIIAWLVTFEDGDNVLGDLGFAGELEEVSHD